MKKSVRRAIFMMGIVLLSSLFLSAYAFSASELKPTLVDTKSKYTLQVWDDTDWVCMPWYNELSKVFEEMYPNIKVKPVGVPCSELGPKLLTSLAAGVPPDVARSLYRLGGISLRGGFMDLSEKTKYWPRRLDFFPAVWELGKVGGKQFAIPQAQMIIGAGYYWKEDFRKAGLRFFEPDEQVDWNQIMEVLKKLKAAFPERKNYYPTAVPASWMMGALGCILAENGARYWSEDFEKPVWDSPEAIEAFEFYVNLYRKGYAARPVPGAAESQSQRTEVFLNRNCSIIFPMDLLLPRYLSHRAPELVGEEHWGVFIPVAPGKEPVALSWLYSSSIPTGVPHAEASWAWIELMCTRWGMSRILRDSKYFPTMTGFPMVGVSEQIKQNYLAFQPYIAMRSDELSNYKYPGAMDIVQEMIEKMFYTNENIATIAREYKQKVLEYIEEQR